MEQPAATSILQLQPEILNQIFHKLPIKSVVYCKLVLKQWRSLISDPLFITNYNNISSAVANPLNLFMIPYKPSTKIPPTCYEIDTSPDHVTTRHPQPLPLNFAAHDRVAVLGSVNGLVGLYKDPGEFCLFNPCTGEEKTVHVDALVDGEWKMNWCADLLFGLCFDPIRKSYNAVLSVSSRGTCRFVVVSFDDDGGWKVKTQPGMEHPSYVAGVEVGSLVNGVPYWASGDSVFFFDREKDEFRMMGRPKEWARKKVCGLGCLGGKLSVAVSGNKSTLEVWEMEQKSWSKVFVIVKGSIQKVSLLWGTKGGDSDDEEIVMDVNEEEVMVYSVGSQSLRKVENKMWRTLYKIVTYVPSLSSPA